MIGGVFHVVNNFFRQSESPHVVGKNLRSTAKDDQDRSGIPWNLETGFSRD